MSESLDMPFQWPLRNIDEARRMIVAVQDWAAAAGLDLRQPPEIPDSCCGRGCNGCVWEGYFAALRYWRDQAADRLGVNTGLSH